MIAFCLACNVNHLPEDCSLNWMKHMASDEIKYWWEDDNEIELLTERRNTTADVLSISAKNGKIVFTEMCDEWNCVEFTKEEAIAALEQAISWIRKQ